MTPLDPRVGGRIFDGTDHECQKLGRPSQTLPQYDHTRYSAYGGLAIFTNPTSCQYAP